MDKIKTNKRVLVVDDEPGVLRFISAGLALAGYDVVTATNGEDSLQLLQKDKFDILLLDIVMAPVSGWQVLEKLRAFSQVPVIAFSARDDVGNLTRRNGATVFIAKPFKPEELLSKIRETLGEAGDAGV